VTPLVELVLARVAMWEWVSITILLRLHKNVESFRERGVSQGECVPWRRPLAPKSCYGDRRTFV